MRAPDSWLYFLTALTKGEESKLISEAQLEEAIGRRSVQEAKEALRGTRLGDRLLTSKTDSLREIEAALWGHLSDCIGELLSFTTIPRGIIGMIRAYSMRYDLFNLIFAIRRILQGAGPSTGFLSLGIMGEMGLLAELEGVGGPEGLCDLLWRCGLKRYGNVLSKYSKFSAEELGAKRAAIEEELWEAYYSELLSISKELRDPHLAEAVRVSVMISNLKAIFRALSEGGAGFVGGLVLRHLLPLSLIESLDSIRLEDLSRLFEGSGYGAMLNEALSARAKGGLLAVESIFNKWEELFLRDLLSRRLFLPSTIYWYLIQKEFEIRRVRMAFTKIFEGIAEVH
ncbi:MAG: V-type ATPase subunit [Candidatus Bathyarchaeia archaeon]